MDGADETVRGVGVLAHQPIVSRVGLELAKFIDREELTLAGAIDDIGVTVITV
jgi:hypothetical protein